MLWPQRECTYTAAATTHKHTQRAYSNVVEAEKMVQKQLIYYETQPKYYVHCVHMLPFNHKRQPSSTEHPIQSVKRSQRRGKK